MLRLDLDYAGLDAAVLYEFRNHLVAGGAEWLLLGALLAWARARRLLKARGRRRTDPTHVLAAIRALNRVEAVGETLRHPLDALAVVALGWRRAICRPDWGERYGRRFEEARLPKGQTAREALAVAIGADGHALLRAVYAPAAPAWLREIPAVATRKRVPRHRAWVQQFRREEGAVRWRTADDIPSAAVFIGSPYDEDAHDARKYTTSRMGHKIHCTEACDEDAPRLITHVGTTSASVVDAAATPAIHQALQGRDLLPAAHLVDSGYLDAPNIVAQRQEYGVELCGPARPDYQRPPRERTGFALADFHLARKREQATCPAGRTSRRWRRRPDPAGRDLIWVTFSSKDCGPCAHRPACGRSQVRSLRQTLCLRPRAQFEALQAARQRETTADFGARYAARAGIQDTLARGVRRCRLRRTRYRGQPKVHPRHILTATGLNFLRLGEWFAGTPRHSPFARLLAAPTAA